MKTIDLTYRTLLAAAAALLLAACQRDEPLGPEDGGRTRLSAYKERMITRASATDEYFKEGTQYRIWTSDPTVPKEGIVGTEAIRSGDNARYIDLGDYGDGLSSSIDFYGLTLGTETAPEASSVNNGYPISLSATDGSGDFPDYRRGALPAGSATASRGILRMPFRHIMSKVRLMVMREPNVKSELKLVSVAFLGAKNGEETTGVAVSGTYNVQDNLFTFSEPEKRQRTVNPAGGSLPVPVVGAGEGQSNEATEVREVLVFPEKGVCLPEGDAASGTQMYYLRVTFKDPGNFYDLRQSTAPEDTDVSIDIPIADNRITDRLTPLHFEQNTAYTLCISFLSNTARIVTLVPKVYEWMDGEKSDEGNWSEQDLGQPLTFNGVVWNARNLGASNAHSSSGIDQWRQSVGYFYQYGRNIPYFPNNVIMEDGKITGIDLNTPLADALQTNGQYDGSRPLYPVIRFESWGTTAEDLQTYHTNGLRQFIAPTPYMDDKLIWKQGDHGDYSAGKGGSTLPAKTRWCFSYDKNNGNCADWYRLHKLGGYRNDWQTNTDYTPCPQGWRLPTVAEFRGIVPGSGYAGNISFRVFDHIGTSGGWEVSTQDMYKEPNFQTKFSAANIKNYTGMRSSDFAGQVIYEGFFPCIFRAEENDPATGDRSQYVLSMMNEDGFRDWTRVKDLSGQIRQDGDYIYNWGVIYGIKKQGTPSAYRMKWEIKLVSKENPVLTGSGEPDKPSIWIYNETFRGVLVISRYAASKTDEFKADENGSYKASVKSFDWEHPVETMEFPVGGIADSWSEGKLANIGTEAWYAIGELPDKDWGNLRKKNIFWFKFAGTSTNNQTMMICSESKMHASVQIRCVRDLDGGGLNDFVSDSY